MLLCMPAFSSSFFLFKAFLVLMVQFAKMISLSDHSCIGYKLGRYKCEIGALFLIVTFNLNTSKVK